MKYITETQVEKSKDFIFRKGRLLERQLFRYFFEEGNVSDCLDALRVYQNMDGGFGNGLEPDLLCPDSSAIGAESALFILEMLDESPLDILDLLVRWLETVQLTTGVIPHPPEGLQQYPHQPWWANPDDKRVLFIAALLKLRGVKAPAFFKQVEVFYESISEKDLDNFYNYPIFAYASTVETENKQSMVDQLPEVLEEHSKHFPLFSRYWFYAQEYCSDTVIDEAAQQFITGIEDDGGLKDLYPELPWWRPIFTLDGLILLKRLEQR